MPLLTAHFSEEELGGSTGAPVAVRANLARLAREVLEPLRAILGVPLIITSGYRAPEKNVAAGGVNTSQHLDGTAADVTARGLSLYDVSQRVDAAELDGRMPLYGELIYYPYTTGHFHISLPTRSERREKMVKLGGEAGGYAAYSAATFPGRERRRTNDSRA